MKNMKNISPILQLVKLTLNHGDKIFIVHGHDNGLKNEVARFLEKLKLTPIILHEQASEGETIIEQN